MKYNTHQVDMNLQITAFTLDVIDMSFDMV